MYKIVRYIQANPSAKVEITGYTDVQGSEDYNLNLSERRANAVYKVLIELFKVPSNNLSTNYLGEEQPLIDSNISEAYYQLNDTKKYKLCPY